MIINWTSYLSANLFFMMMSCYEIFSIQLIGEEYHPQMNSNKTMHYYGMMHLVISNLNFEEKDFPYSNQLVMFDQAFVHARIEDVFYKIFSPFSSFSFSNY